MSSSQRHWLVLALLLLAVGLVHIGCLREGHVWGDDFAGYLMHARNLALGRPFAEIDYLYNPNYPSLGPPTYPPGCAVALAPLYRLFGLNLEVFKLEMVAMFVLALLAAAFCFHRQLGLVRISALILILGLNHFALKDTNSIASDLPFLAILYLTLFLAEKAEDAPQGSRERLLYFGLTGLAAYLAFGTRTLGALVIPAMLARELITTRRIQRPAILATLIFVALTVLQSVFLHSDRHYLDQFNVAPMVVVHNAAGYVVRLAAFWHNGYFKVPSMVLFVLVTGLSLIGYVESLHRRITVYETFLPLYMTVILLWPSYQAERFFYPALPLYLFYALRGLEHNWIAGHERIRRLVVATLVAGISLTYAASMIHLERGPLPEGVMKPESQALFEHLRKTTSNTDVLVFIKPRALALFTGRKASVYHCPLHDQDLWDYFHQIHATRLVVAENDAAFAGAEQPQTLAFLRAFVDRNRKRLEPECSNADFSVYKITE